MKLCKQELDTLRKEVVEWKQAYDGLMEQYQRLIHDYEELRRAVSARHRNGLQGQDDLAGSDPEP